LSEKPPLLKVVGARHKCRNCRINKKIAAFDILLPYGLFHEFEYAFKPASLEAKFGKLVIDTRSNKVIYRVKSFGGVVTEVYADEEDKESILANKEIILPNKT